MHTYDNRYHAGKILAEYLHAYLNKENTIIIAIPRGGVPVAYEVALALSLPLELLVVQKLSIPGMRELTLGSLAENCLALNESVIHTLGFRKTAIEHIIRTERQELHRRQSIYHEYNQQLDLTNKTVIIIDDGIGTGCTMKVAIEYLKNSPLKKIVIATPIAKKATFKALCGTGYEVICPHLMQYLDKPELWYQDYSPISEAEVLELLQFRRA